MNLTAPASVTAATLGQRIRVMIVDDAIVVRGLFSRWVEAEPDMEVVASLRTGREAVTQLERANPDVVVLDIDMPDMDGIVALPLLLAKKRDLIVIMASTLTRRNAEISLRALSLGATDYIPKPSSNREVSGSPEFHRDLIEKIRHLGLRAKSRRHIPSPPLVPSSQPAAAPGLTSAEQRREARRGEMLVVAKDLDRAERGGLPGEDAVGVVDRVEPRARERTHGAGDGARQEP